MDRRVLQPADGTTTESFGPREWAMTVTTAVTWGSSYLWIAIGLESFSPAMVGWLRMVFGVGILLVLTARTYRRIERSDWFAVSIVGLIGNAVPAVLFGLAEQRIESAVVGMITGATPLVTLAMALALGTRNLRRIHFFGLALGFGGIVMMSVPNLTGEGASALGVGFVFAAVVAYSINTIVLGPLQAKYGGLTVLRAAQMMALVALTPFMLLTLDETSFTWRSLIAVAILGVFGTGIARAVYANLIGRAGAARSGVVGYLVPVTAVILGVLVLDERVGALELGGLAVVLIGAFMTTQRTSVNADRAR